MSATLRTGSGLAVLCSGLLVVAGIQIGAGGEPAGQAPAPEPAPTTAPAAPVEVAGLSPAVAGLLESRGMLGRLSTDQLTMFPPEVARVLVEHGVVLAVPEGGQ